MLGSGSPVIAEISETVRQAPSFMAPKTRRICPVSLLRSSLGSYSGPSNQTRLGGAQERRSSCRPVIGHRDTSAHGPQRRGTQQGTSPPAPVDAQQAIRHASPATETHPWERL